MPRALDQIMADFAALKPSDFEDEGAGLDKLRVLTEELLAQPHPEQGIPALFAIMERMPVTEMGAPGPLVHALERMRGHYEGQLDESVKRRPAKLSVWMINRILNGTRDSGQRQVYLDLLRIAAEHPSAPESVKSDARHFVQYQSRRA